MQLLWPVMARASTDVERVVPENYKPHNPNTRRVMPP